MKKNFLIPLLFLIVQALFSEAIFNYDDTKIEKNELVTLSCDWDFYWGRFIDPMGKFIDPDFTVEVPSAWNYYDLPQAQKEIAEKGTGAGSYRLRLCNLKPDTQYSFTTYGIGYTAFKMFSNGELIFQAGEPDVDWKKSKMQQYMDVASFTTDSNGEAVLVMWISNKDYRKGGLRKAIKFHETQGFYKSFHKDLAYYMILEGVLLGIIIYSMLLFFMKKEKASLFLAIFVFTILARVAASVFPIPKYFFRNIPYSLMIRFEYLAISLGPASYTLYASALQKNIFKKVKAIYFAIPGFVFVILDFALPLYYASRMVPFMQAYVFIIIFIDFVLILIQVCKMKDVISLPMLLTILIIGIGAANDILLNRYITIINIRLLVPSFVVFAISQTTLLAHVQNRSLIIEEKLNENLKETNKAYYRFVPREFLDLLSKKDITEVRAGEWKSARMGIMSADIRNFTALSEKMSEMQVFDLLNSYLGRVAPIIRKYDGIIEKYLGDGIIAVFPESAEKALCCAIEMQEEMVSLRQEFLKKGFPEIKIGIGLHYGNLIIATGGDNERMAEISLSDDIDIAVKTEAATKEFKRPIIVTRQILAKASAEVKKENKKFPFMGHKIENTENQDLFYIFSDKTGVEL